MITLKNITYKDRLHGINLEIKEHEFIWMTGNRESGIKELIEICCGFRKPDHGHIEIDGHQNLKSRAYWKEIDYLSYDAYWEPDQTILKNLWLPRSAKNVDLILYENGIMDTQARICDLTNEQKLQVMLARSLLKQAKILFLYEWMYGLEGKAENRMMQRLMKAYHRYHLTIVYANSRCPKGFRQIYLDHGYMSGDGYA